MNAEEYFDDAPYAQMTAPTLGELYEEQEGLSFREWKAKQDIADRKVVLIPQDDKGVFVWPGKNDAQRDAARDITCLDDEVLQNLKAELAEIKKGLSEVNGLISNLEEARREREWKIRREQNAVLRELAIQRNTRAPEGSDAHLFDDVMQAEADREISEETDEMPF